MGNTRERMALHLSSWIGFGSVASFYGYSSPDEDKINGRGLIAADKMQQLDYCRVPSNDIAFSQHSYFFQSSVLTPRKLLVASPAVCPVPIIPNSVQSKANAFLLQFFSHAHPSCQLVGMKLQRDVGRYIPHHFSRIHM